MSKKEFVYKHLRTSILNGTFGSGQRIVIDQVAKEMGMSIIPARSHQAIRIRWPHYIQAIQRGCRHKH